MGRTTPLDADGGLANMFDQAQAQGYSREEVDVVLLRLRALQAQLNKEQQDLARQQDTLSDAYTAIIERIRDSEREFENFNGRLLGNYTEVAAEHLRTLSEVTQRNSERLYLHMQIATPESGKYTQLQLDLDARLWRAINEFI